jgi:acetylornithine deacetylase/succinyl-diaminopimelate desuccinylase-like protein
MRSSRLAVAMAAFLMAGALLPGVSKAQDDGPDGEVVALLQQLIQTNTSNPPGNEAQIAELLKARLAPLGFEVEIVPTPTAGKAHFIARLRAENPTEKPLLLAGHEDVVGVERDLWTVDPFAGLVKGGLIYGRGSMDFKGGLAAFTVAASRIARAKVPLKRDIILLAEADEEGGSYGTGWLAKDNWPKLDAGVSLNEGGWVFEDGGGTPRLMGVTTIDKNSLSVTLKTRGTSTHSSRPLPDSALAHLTRALNRIERYEPATPRPGATARRYLRAWAKGFGGRRARQLRTFLAAKTAKARRRTARPLTRGSFGELFNGLLRTIYVPTIVSGGFRANVLPGSAEATVNIRLLPGAKPRPAIRELERVIGDKRVKVAPISSEGETAADTLGRFDKRAKQAPSSTDTELYRVLAKEGKREWPTAAVTPALFEAGTDAVPWRERGIPVYGVYPYPISRAELADMHGNDEHISIRRLEEGTDMLTRVVRGAASER